MLAGCWLGKPRPTSVLVAVFVGPHSKPGNAVTILCKPRVSVVLREAGERTLENAKAIVAKQLRADTWTMINKPSVREGFLCAIEHHLKARCSFGITLDADVLVRPNGLELLLDEFETHQAEPVIGYFRMLCKLHGGYAFVGVNVFRCAILKELLSVGLNMPTTLRPDADAIQVLRERGEKVQLFNTVIGLHDYHQYYSHIYIKMFNRVRRSRSTPLLAKRFHALASNDDDLKAAMAGLEDGVKDENRSRLVWTHDFPDINARVSRLGLTEHGPEQVNVSSAEVERVLNEFESGPHGVSWRATEHGVALSYGDQVIESIA